MIYLESEPLIQIRRRICFRPRPLRWNKRKVFTKKLTIFSPAETVRLPFRTTLIYNLKKPAGQLGSLDILSASEEVEVVFDGILKIKPLRLLLVAAAAVACLSGCLFSSTPSLREELVNTGPVALDPANPFVVGSQFIQTESNNSELLKKFLEFRGQPSAVEVRKKFLGPVKVYLFYLDKHEAYRLDQGADDWIVRGPEKIPADVLKTINGAASASRGESPVESTEGEGPEGDLLEKDSLPSLRSSEKKLKELPKRKETAKRLPPPELASENAVDAKSTESKVFDDFSDSTTEETEEKQGKKAAHRVSDNLEVAASGDLIHTVSYPGETLRIISSWYIGDPNSAGRVARINSLDNADRLEIGQTVRIPRYMAVNTEPLPEGEIARYNDKIKSR